LRDGALDGRAHDPTPAGPFGEIAMTVHADPAELQPTTLTALERRAIALWPRLDRAALRRCRQDPARIADLVARRTTLPPEAIRQVLLTPAVTDDEVSTWFG
jgi:hypothetical protein